MQLGMRFYLGGRYKSMNDDIGLVDELIEWAREGSNRTLGMTASNQGMQEGKATHRSYTEASRVLSQSSK